MLKVLNNYKEEDIIINKNEVPTIWYEDNNNNNVKRRYYVDIFIPKENLCIEVKSNWTINFSKTKSSKELGYEIWVYDNKGNRLELYN